MSQNLPLDPGAASQEPRIRAFQLDASAFGNLNDSVNRFRGDLNLPMKLVQLTGRNGLDIVVSAFYGSNVREEASTWNAAAPTSVLGLGWSIPSTLIFVDDKNAGNTLAGDYYLQYGGGVHALIWVGEDAEGIIYQCREFPLWKIRYRRAGEIWTVVREDGMSDVYGDAALPESDGTLMYGVKWGNWIGASRSDRPEPSRFVMGWNLARSSSPWGDALTYRYRNDQPEVVAGLRYTRSSDLREIVDMLGQSVRFEYEPKKPFEYVPPHQTADGSPDPLYQDRYDVNALTGIAVRTGGESTDVLYQLAFSYRFANVTGTADDAFAKRLLTAITQTRGGAEELPPVLFEYYESPTDPNPGAMRRLTLPEGAVITVEYADKVLNRSDLAGAARADLTTSLFDKNITVASPDPSKPYRPFVWQGYDYLVIGWYTETASSRLDVTVYQFGGRWSEPWKMTCPIAGRIDVSQVRVALGADFFGLYLPDTNANIKPAVYIFQKKRDQFGRWQAIEVSGALDSHASIPAETSLSAGERVLVLHAGGSRRIHRWSFDPIAETWVHAEHAAPNNTARMSVAARDNYYVASYYDDASRRATFQLFFRDAADRWQNGPAGSASTSAFDWLPIYGSRFWSLGATFAAGTFLPTGKSAAVLRAIWWDETFRVIGDKELDGATDGIYLETAAAGSLLANGSFLHRFNGYNWDSVSYQANADTLYAYGEDLALISRVAGGGAETTLAQYDPDAGAWRAQILPRDTTEQAIAEARLTGPAQVFPPTVSADYFTAEDRVYRLLPDASWVQLPETLPVDSTKLSLENRAPGYLVFEDQVSDPRERKTIAWLLDSGGVVGRKEYPGQRIYTGDDPASSSALLAGYRAFVTYPADRDINAVDKIFLHRVLNHSLDDLQTDAVVATVRQELGDRTLLAGYDYDGDTAVFDTSGQVVQYPSVVQTNGTSSDPSAAGSSVYEFYNGLADQVAGDPGLEAHYSLLAGFLRRSAERDAAGIELASDETVWQAVELLHGPESPVGVLLAATQIKEGSTVSTLSGLAGGGSVVKRTDSTYDPATAMQLSSTLRNHDASGKPQDLRRELLYAWQVPAYAGMKAARMLSRVAQETLSNATAATGISATATTYRNRWEGGAGEVWDQSESWAWRGETKTPGTFDFADSPEKAGDRSGWLLQNRIDRRGSHGKPLLLTDVDGVQTSFLYDLSGWYQVAMFRNADAGAAPSQASYYGFESYETPQGWMQPGGGALPPSWFDGTVSYGGLRSLRVPGDGGGLEARFGIPADKGRAVLSCWVRTLPGFPAGQAAWTVTAGGGPARELPIPDTGGEWRYLFLYVELGGGGTVDVVCRLKNPAGKELWLDDLRVAPVAGDFAARVYDPATFMPLGLLDANTAATRQVYDVFLRPLAVVGATGQVVQIQSRYLSRTGNGGRYNPGDLNGTLEIKPAAGGFHENLRGGDWQERWSSPAPSHWSGADGGIRHLGAARDVLALKDSATESDYGIRLTVTPPAGGKVDRPLGLQVGDGLTVQWVPAGEWQMLGAGGVKVASFPEAAFVPGSWLLLAGRHGVMFYRNGRLLLSHTFAEEIAGELRLFTETDGLLLRQILVFFAPQATTSYTNGIGQEIQQQALADGGTVARATLYDGASRPAIQTKSRPYDGAGFQFQPRLVTGFDPVSGRMTGELSDYYDGRDGRSNDEGYPYARSLYAGSSFERLLESGQAGRPLAITASPAAERHTVRYTHAANREGSFPGGLPAGLYGVLVTTDPQGNRQEVTTDLTGRAVASQAFAAGGDKPLQQTSFVYDERGRLSRILLPNYYQPPVAGTGDGFVMEMRYDGLGRQISQQSSDTGISETIYDDAGRPRFTLPADGRSADPAKEPNRIRYQQYDPLGRLLASGRVEALWDDALRHAARDPEWLPPGAEWQTRNLYDGDGLEPWAIGQVTRTETRLATGGTFTQEVAYDVAGNLRRVTERVEGDGGSAATTEYLYGPAGQLLETRYPQEKDGARLVVTRSYDKQGRLSAIGQPGEGLAGAFATYTYDALGNVATEILGPSGAVATTRYEYNPPGALSRIDGSAFRQSLAYYEQPGYGGTTYYNGVVARADTSYLAAGSPRDSRWLYAYDGLSRLTAAENLQTPADSLGAGPNPFRFDADGNILRYGVGADGARVRAYEYYAGTDRLRNADAPGTDGYRYDRDGDTIATPEPAHAELAVNFVTGLTERIVDSGRGETQEIDYGVADQRVRVQRRSQSGGGVTAERRYFHGGTPGGPLAEVRGAGGTREELAYVYGPLGLIALVARASGGTGETRAFVVRDSLGSSRLLLEASGSLLGGYDYGPFGAATAPPVGTRPDLLAYRFTGQEWDAGAGLYNFKARLYDPAIQRFLGPDPANESYSPYLYVGNNPLSFVDPTGEFSIGGFFASLGEIAAGIVLAPVLGAAAPLLIGAGITGIVYSAKTDDSNFSWSRWAEVEGAAAIATAEIGIGITLQAAGEFPGAAALGATFIGAGVSSYMYTATNTQDFDWNQYGISMGIGALSGALTGGFGELGAAAAAQVTSNVAKIAISAGFNAAGGASSGYLGQGFKNVAAGQSWKDAFTNDNTWKAALIQGGVGAGVGVVAWGMSAGWKSYAGNLGLQAPATGAKYLQVMKSFNQPLRALVGGSRVVGPAIFNTSSQITAHTLFKPS